MNCRSYDLGRINDTKLKHIAITILVSVIALGLALETQDAIHNHATVQSRILSNTTQRLVENIAYDLNTQPLVTFNSGLVQDLASPNERNTTAGDNSFLKRCLRCRLGILDQRLSFLHLGFCRSTTVDLGDAAGEFRKSFLQLLTIVLTIGDSDFTTDLITASIDINLLARTTDDHGVFRRNPDLLGTTQIGEFDTLQFYTEVFKYRSPCSENADVAHDRLATVAVTRRLYRGNLQDTSHFINNQCR